MTSLKLGKKAGLKFPEKVKLLSVFQNSPGDVSNFHTAITYEKMAVSMSLKTGPQHFLIGGAAFNNWADIKNTLVIKPLQGLQR